jgi:hypothetical protein
MNLNHSCGTGAFLIKSSPDVLQLLRLLSLKLTLCIRQRWAAHKFDMFHFRNCFFTEVSASKHLKPRAKLLRNKCKELTKGVPSRVSYSTIVLI